MEDLIHISAGNRMTPLVIGEVLLVFRDNGLLYLMRWKKYLDSPLGMASDQYVFRVKSVKTPDNVADGPYYIPAY